MAASFPTPPVKKPPSAFPARRGKIKAQIFGGIAGTVASAASRAGHFLGLVRGNDAFALAAPPNNTTETMVATKSVLADGEDGRAL